jgi:hypothetical protein
MKEDKMDGACSTHRIGKKWHRIFVGKPEGKKPLQRPKRRWENNIKIDLDSCSSGFGTMN